MKKDKKKSVFWKSMWEYSKGHHGKLIFAFILCLSNGVFCALQPTVIKHIVDDGISNPDLTNTVRLQVAAMWACVYAFVSYMRVFSWGIGYKSALKAIEGFLFNVRAKFFNHIQSLCMRFYDSSSAGELFSYIMGTPMASLKNFLVQFALNVPVHIVATTMALVTMFSYDWLLTIVMAVGIFISVVINVLSRPKIRRQSKELIESESEASKYIDNMIHGSGAIKMYAIEDNVYDKFSEHIGELRNKGVKLTFSQWLSGARAEVAQYTCTTFVYIIGAFSCIYRELTVGELVAFVNCMGIITGGFTAIFNTNLLKASAESGLERIMKVLDIRTTTPDKEYSRNVDVEAHSAKRKEKPCVEFRNVDFGYEDRMIFEDFNCSINFNESVALVGTSGSGKSTITKLIMRLYEINDGELRMYGRNIQDFTLHDLRKSIGIVPQDPYIFQGTILENIRMAYPEAPMQQVMEAMEIARVHEFVNDMPKGWNTVVGDDGYGLSGGQRQRIAIARAILGNPQILIFDEATSALDNISEKYVQTAMEELMATHTVIVVAHRLSTIRNVDRILVFDKGKVVEEGNFNELLEKNGLFRKMYDAAQSE